VAAAAPAVDLAADTWAAVADTVVADTGKHPATSRKSQYFRNSFNLI
jgi:hypothetical protein